jgi:hypothetical protein
MNRRLILAAKDGEPTPEWEQKELEQEAARWVDMLEFPPIDFLPLPSTPPEPKYFPLPKF